MMKKAIVFLLVLVFSIPTVAGTAQETSAVTIDVTDPNAAYRYIVGETDAEWTGDIFFEDMAYILSKLFDIPRESLGVGSSPKVRHGDFMDLLWRQADTTLIERNYSAETAYLNYEQFFDALNHFYFDIIQRHGLIAKPASVYRLSGKTHFAFDDGRVITTEEISFPDGRATVTCLGDRVIAVSAFETPYDLRFSSIGAMEAVKGRLYYYSQEEKMLLLNTKDGIRRFDIIGNPICFAIDGIERDKLNETMLDKTVTIYVTNHKKMADVVVMIRL